VWRQEGKVVFETAPPESNGQSSQSNSSAPIALDAPAWASSSEASSSESAASQIETAVVPVDVPEFSATALEIAPDGEAEVETEPVESVAAPEMEALEAEDTAGGVAQAGAGVVGRVRSGLGRIMNRKKGSG
jgi:hypothetical protein